MNWQIPAKTFLLGEYAALTDKSAIILTTTPCFELTLSLKEEALPFHPESPAGLWFNQEQLKTNVNWTDPYGCGGLGASSAQFLAIYLASCHLRGIEPRFDQMLRAYHQVAWSGQGLKPSGYDVIAQSQHGCVFINKAQNLIKSYSWPFDDLAFFLIHTNTKLATHEHLQTTTLPQTEGLSKLVDEAHMAFQTINVKQLLYAINTYHEQLVKLNLVANHSLKWIEEFKNSPEILAMKGCGALGADVLLFICAKKDKQELRNKFLFKKLRLLATESNLSSKKNLIYFPDRVS